MFCSYLFIVNSFLIDLFFIFTPRDLNYKPILKILRFGKNNDFENAKMSRPLLLFKKYSEKIKIIKKKVLKKIFYKAGDLNLQIKKSA